MGSRCGGGEGGNGVPSDHVMGGWGSKVLIFITGLDPKPL